MSVLPDDIPCCFCTMSVTSGQPMRIRVRRSCLVPQSASGGWWSDPRPKHGLPCRYQVLVNLAAPEKFLYDPNFSISSAICFHFFYSYKMIIRAWLWYQAFFMIGSKLYDSGVSVTLGRVCDFGLPPAVRDAVREPDPWSPATVSFSDGCVGCHQIVENWRFKRLLWSVSRQLPKRKTLMKKP